KYQPALIAFSRALHDVEIVVHEKDLSRAAGILLVNFDESINPALIVGLRQVPVEVVLPEYTRIAFVRENESVCQQLVIDDGTVTHDVVIFHERDSLFRTIDDEHSLFSKIPKTESVAVAQVS